MQLLANRLGLAIVTKANTVISLGWNVWGVDFADGRYIMWHLMRPRVFVSLKKWGEK